MPKKVTIYIYIWRAKHEHANPRQGDSTTTSPTAASSPAKLFLRTLCFGNNHSMSRGRLWQWCEPMQRWALCHPTSPLGTLGEVGPCNVGLRTPPLGTLIQEALSIANLGWSFQLRLLLQRVSPVQEKPPRKGQP